MIAELPSREALIQKLAGIPMGGFLQFEVYPPADFNKSMQARIDACKQAEKLFPSVPK